MTTTVSGTAGVDIPVAVTMIGGDVRVMTMSATVTAVVGSPAMTIALRPEAAPRAGMTMKIGVIPRRGGTTMIAAAIHRATGMTTIRATAVRAGGSETHGVMLKRRAWGGSIVATMMTMTGIPRADVLHVEMMTMIVVILRHAAMTMIAVALRRAAVTMTIRATAGKADGLVTPKAMPKLLAAAGTTAAMRMMMTAAILRGGVANLHKGAMTGPLSHNLV